MYISEDILMFVHLALDDFSKTKRVSLEKNYVLYRNIGLIAHLVKYYDIISNKDSQSLYNDIDSFIRNRGGILQ